MEFRGEDSLLSMSVIRPHAEDDSTPQQFVFTITDGGFAKRSRIEEYRLQSRGGLGIKTMKQDDDRGNLVGGFIVVDGDEVLAHQVLRAGHPQRHRRLPARHEPRHQGRQVRRGPRG